MKKENNIEKHIQLPTKKDLNINQENSYQNKPLKTIWIQLLCQSIIWTQISLPRNIFAQEEEVTTETVAEINETNEENKLSQSQTGTVSACSSQRTAYSSYTQLQDEYTDYTSNLSTNISNFVSNANQDLTELLAEQATYYETSLGFVNPTTEIEADYNAIRTRWITAQSELSDAQSAESFASSEYNTALSACDDDHEYCDSQERSRISVTRANLTAAQSELSAAQAQYNAARSEYRSIPNNMDSESSEAINGTAENINEMANSHAISGCGSNFDITTNTDQECSLSGPLFEKDTAITEIINQNLSEAKDLAIAREQALFELELQQTYDADYKLYKLAVNNTTGETQGYDANGDGDYDDVELGEYISKSQASAELELSNMKTMSLASASIRNMVCEKHDRSESEPQSYYLFRAAMATWLTAVVNDTDYYAQESSCMVDEAITSDEKNDQIQTIERAANLSEQQLKSLCLRARPSLDDVIDTTSPSFLDDSNPDGWKKYSIPGTSVASAKSETITYINNLNKVITGYTDTDINVTYPPLATRCDTYLQEIIGDDYDPTQARTREYALEMIQEALAVATEELAAKREKLVIAYSNVQKGEQWVEEAQRNIVIMTALAAVVYGAKNIARSICSSSIGFSPMCAVASALSSKYLYITGTVIGIWLVSELMRAQSFLAQWREKLENYKYFTHMACNFESAFEEKLGVQALGEIYNEKRKEVLQDASNEVINEVNNLLYQEISGNDTTAQLQSSLDKINKKIVHIKNINQLQQTLSQIFFKASNRVSDVATLFSTLGISIMIKSLPGQDAIAQDTSSINQEEIYNTTNSLNIQTGTGNFTYFLTQRNQQFQNLTNDITYQPNHTTGSSEISNTGVKSVINAQILSVHQLAAPFTGGDAHDPLEDIEASLHTATNLSDTEKLALMKTGFATPETRVVTLQNALNLMTDNLTLLEGSIAVAGYNLDGYVSLLDTTRKELEIEEEGLGNVAAQQVLSPTNACLSEDSTSGLNVDSTCMCRESGSCASFQFPTFNIEVPEALRSSAQSTVDTANNITNGNLAGANISGATLMNNAANVRNILNDSENNSINKTSSNTNGNDLNKASESSINSTLSALGENPTSRFNNLRNSLAHRTSTSNANALASVSSAEGTNENNSNLQEKDSSTSLSKSTSSLGGKQYNSSNQKRSKAFSLSEGSMNNFNLGEFDDDQKKRYGSSNDGLTNDDVIAINQNKSGHKRNISSVKGSNSNSSMRGIHSNRKKSIFTIISTRYEKSAFPILLKTKKNIK